MSLLDDVSIVVTPNGYKAGELYAVVPVPSEGAEEVTNGDFATDSDWTLESNASISNNELTLNSSSGNVYALQSLYSSGLYNGKTLQFTYEIISNNLVGSGNLRGGGLSGASLFPSLINLNSEVGTHTINIIIDSSGSNNALDFYITNGYTSGSIVIDNISVKEYTSADMDVTRATAATRVDENGLVNYAEILGGEEVVNGDFSGGSTGWTVTGSDADNYVVFDGSTARLKFLNVSPVTTLNSSFLFTSGKTYKLVVDVASVTSGGVKVDGSGVSELFNTVGINTRIIQPTGSGTLGFYRATANVDLTFNSVSLKEVTRDNVPRIDYTGGGCPHILAEPQRTNLLPYSEAFGSWHTVNNVTITQDTTETTSPSGTNNASKILVSSASTPRRLFEVISTSSGSDYTFTLYAKKGTTDFIRVYFSSSIIDISFDLTNGTKTVTAGTGSIESVGNDWYRIQGTGTSSLTTEVPQIQLSNSASVNDYLYIWGSQLEEGSYATSYIPTSGSTVTRNQDLFTRDGIGSLINSTEGVLFVEWKPKLSSDYSFISINNGSITDSVIIGKSNNTTNMFIAVRSSNVYQALYTSGVYDFTIFNKVAVKWKLNDISIWINGTESTNWSSGSSPVGLSKLSFDFGNGTENFYGKVKQLQVYKAALTDVQLAALTS